MVLLGVILSFSPAYSAPLKITVLGSQAPDYSVKTPSRSKLTEIIDKVLEAYPSAQRAKVDLVQFVFEQGPTAYVPRALFKKRTWILESTQAGKLELVPPVRDNELTKEGFWMDPLKRKGVVGIELIEANAQYKKFYLIKRSDPVASRGERLYLQACVTCHTSPDQWLRQQAVVPSVLDKHPAVNGSEAPYGTKELKSVHVYAKSWLSEQKSD